MSVDVSGMYSRRKFLVAGAAACALSASFVLGGCGMSSPAKSVDDSKVQVVASFYPMYDFASKIGGDRVQVTCLVPAGTEPHDWEPSTADLKAFETADMLVYNGAGMEHWVHDVLESTTNDKLVAVEASKGAHLLELSPEALAEETAEHAAEGGAHAHEHEDEDSKTDPHVWLAPENAKIEMNNIKEALIEIDSDGRETYEANYEKWAAECDALDSEFTKGLSGVSNHSIVVSHEAFGYLCDAYGLTQMPIEGIEADAEPDADQMAKIVDFVKQNNVKTIFSEELVSPKVAQAIADASGAQVEELNPLEGLSDEELAAGEEYFSVMRSNLDALKKALA